MAKSASSESTKKLGTQHITLLVVLIVAIFSLFQFKVMPSAVMGFINYLFAPSGEELQKLEMVSYDGSCLASSSKEAAAKVISQGAHDPNKELINGEFIFDFTFKERTLDENGYAKTSSEWVAKATNLGEFQIILEPWIAFWYLSLVIAIVLSLLITMFLPSSVGFMAILFDLQVDNTKAKIRLQTGFQDEIVDLLTRTDDKLAEVDFQTAEPYFRTIWERTESDVRSNKRVLEFDEVFDENVDIVRFREIHLYSRIKEFFSDFVLKEIEDTKNGIHWRRNHIHVLKGFRLYMAHHFTEKYSNMVTGMAYGGAALLVVSVGIRGLKFIPAAKPSIILFSTLLEFTMLCLMALTMLYTEEEERMDKMLKKMEDSNKSSLESLKSQQHDIHQLTNVLVGQSAEIIKTRVEAAITGYMTSDDNVKKVVAQEISEKILHGMREAFANPVNGQHK